MTPPGAGAGADGGGAGAGGAGAGARSDGAGAGAGAVALAWRAPEIAQELPGLNVLTCEVEPTRPGPLTGESPLDVLARLRELSNRFRGARAIAIRREPLPAAYRVFFRQSGLDPDVKRTPTEAAVLERMLRGGFPTGGLLEDVLLIALLETGVPVWALDADTLLGPPGVRVSVQSEPLGRSAAGPALDPGRLVLADRGGAVAVLFGELAAEHLPARATVRLLLFTVQVAGVPALFAEEALWSCCALLRPS